MNKRIGLVVLIGALGLAPEASQAAWAPKDEPLPNIDKRLEALDQQAAGASSQVSAQALPDSAKARALATLKSRVPGVKVNRDSIVQSPRLIRASHGFLTDKGGYGKAVSKAQLDAIPLTDKHRVVKAFLNENSALFGYDAGELSSAEIKRDYTTKHNGLHTTVWQQTLDGVPVFEGRLIGHVTRDDELVSISSQFVPDAARAADRGTPNRGALMTRPSVSAAEAVVQAAANVGIAVEPNSVTGLAAPEGAEKRQTLRSTNLLGQVSVQLIWLPMNQDSMHLCWRVIFGVPRSMEHYLTLVDVQTGEVLVRHGLTQHLEDASYNIFPSDSPSPFTPGWPTPDTGQPDLVDRTLETVDALDAVASPNGWVPDGPNPPTRGNNADAFLFRQLQVDLDGNYVPDRPRPVGGADRVFDFPMDLTVQAPINYADASTVQLFYRANWYHDRLYQLGFTEAAGNFQMTNFNRGGLEDDPVICFVQFGADYGVADNSAFYTPPDGLSGECYMFVFLGPSPDRDGSLDQEVVTHELTHGLSNRLVGGGDGISQLQTEGMGEGWSDFYAMALLSEESDDINGNYPTGGYASYQLLRDYLGFSFEENYYFGIRRYPYSTDMSVDPLTFKDIDPTQADPHFGIPINPIFGGGDPAEVHNQGEVWCIALWEARANLVEKLGWAEGNELMLQLVTDGMKLAPPNPNFLEARDAIIQADEIDTGGDNFAELWTGFAKRGMGLSAECPRSDTTVGVVEGYDAPNPDGILEVKVTPPSLSSVYVGESIPVYVRVTDVAPVTNATITATVSGSTNLVFRNDGVDPDERANDATYTATFDAPADPGTADITLVIAAPEKDTSTNFVTYYVFVPPPNDNFTNSTKVPVKGNSYLTSLDRATYEDGEPVHAGIVTATNSLWWDYVPAANTNILVDSGETAYRTVVAVYTNNTLTTLSPVASAVGTSSRPGAFVNLSVAAGVPYHIAVACLNPEDAGTLRLQVKPAGQPDTNGPVVTVTSPPSGILVTTNRLYLVGSAVDEGPNQSGIKEIKISVNPIPGSGAATTTVVMPGSSLVGPLSTNWSTVIGPLPGLNEIRVTATDFAGNKSDPVILQAIYRPIEPINDFFADAIPLTETAITNVNTVDATKEVGEPNHAGNIGGKSAWWSYRAPADGLLTLSTTNSSFDTLLAVYTGAPVSNLTSVASNDDAFDGSFGTFSRIDQAVRSNTTYHIAVDGYGGASGVVYLSYDFTPAQVYRLTASSTEGGTVSPASNDYTNNSVVSLLATPDDFFKFDHWQGGVESSDNPLSVTVTNDMNLTAVFIPVVFTDGFESGDLQHLEWITSGDAPWFVQTNHVRAGSFAAQSGPIGNSQSSSLQLTKTFGAGILSFEYRVSSEAGFDKLTFSVDDGNPVLVRSGEVNWTGYQYPLTAGTHTLEWRYSKDPAKSMGEDAAYIDNVDLPLAPTVVSMTLTNVTMGGFDVVFEGNAGQQFFIQASTNLTSWETISTNVATGNVVPFTDPAADQNSVRYYRAVLPLP